MARPHDRRKIRRRARGGCESGPARGVRGREPIVAQESRVAVGEQPQALRRFGCGVKPQNIIVEGVPGDRRAGDRTARGVAHADPQRRRFGRARGHRHSAIGRRRNGCQSSGFGIRSLGRSRRGTHLCGLVQVRNGRHIGAGDRNLRRGWGPQSEVSRDQYRHHCTDHEHGAHRVSPSGKFAFLRAEGRRVHLATAGGAGRSDHGARIRPHPLKGRPNQRRAGVYALRSRELTRSDDQRNDAAQEQESMSNERPHINTSRMR